MVSSGEIKWYHKPFFVVALLLSVGPFGLPCLWKSSAFSPLMKWVLTVAIVLLTIVAVTTTIDAVRIVSAHLKDLGLS